jgi:hypothetical protein
MTLEKAAKLNYKWFHELEWNTGLELHHVWGRAGVLRACRLNFVGLTREEHANHLVTDYIRETHKYGRMFLADNYDRMTGMCKRALEEKCGECPLNGK